MFKNDKEKMNGILLNLRKIESERMGDKILISQDLEKYGISEQDI